MKKLVILILLIINVQLNAQLPTFDNPYVLIISKQVNKIDSLLDDNYQTEQFEIDSIKISEKFWEYKIKTSNYFQKSDTKLEIDFYLQQKELIFIRIIEDSKKYGVLASSITDFYYLKGKPSLIWNYFKRPTGLTMRPDEDINSFYGYNRYFDEEFLKKYANELYNEIKTTHNK